MNLSTIVRCGVVVLTLLATPVQAASPLHAGILDAPADERLTLIQQELSRPLSTSQNEQQALRELVRQEQNTLEKLPQAAVEQRAEAGERLAQVVLGNEFAREAALLGFAPAAANAALSDALRWYSLAASRGYPGALSLDASGVRFYPVRVVRRPAR